MDSPFLLPIGRLVFSNDAKELCLESWALAASALFHRALINIEAKYKVYKKKQLPFSTMLVAHDQKTLKHCPNYIEDSSSMHAKDLN